MLPEKRMGTDVGVGMGVILQLTGLFLARSGDTAAILGGAVLFLISIPVFIWGCMNYAEGKGHSKWVGLVGLASIIGLIVLIMLPDQDRDDSVARLQRRKIVALISMVAGFGLFVFGLWLKSVWQEVQYDRLLDPWRAGCILLGICLVVASLVFMVGNGRR